MKETVKIFTNELEGGWSPYDKEKGMGGSEEAIVYLSAELARQGYDVTVYHSQRRVENFEYRNVKYLDRSKAECLENDIFITFKDSTPWRSGAKARKMIHFSLEVERYPWDTSMLDAFIHTTRFHESRNVWVPSKISKVIPLGVDIESLERNEKRETSMTMLYCSSPDRGLEVLLKDWYKIKRTNPDMDLKVAYGFDLMKACGNPKVEEYADYMLKLMQQPDIQYLGGLSQDAIEKQYWKASYWVLPLQNAESELFCLNAVKSRYCGCLPIVNKIGALQETVGTYIDYDAFVEGVWDLKGQEKGSVKAQRWSDVVKRHWLPLITK